MATIHRTYKYRVESLTVSIGANRFSVEPKMTSNLVIDKDYDNNTFPIVGLDVAFDTDLYHNIINYKTEAKFHLKVRKFSFEGEKNIDKKDFINDTFITFIDNDSPFLNRDLYNQSVKSTAGKSPSDVGSKKMKLFLFKENDVLKTKTIVNTVISSSGMTNTIAYLYSIAGVKSLLMSPLDNKQSYAEMIIPPMTMLSTILDLEKRYGFYKTGSMIFFDIDLAYLLKRSATATAWKRGEYYKVSMEVPLSSGENAIKSGVTTDTTKKQYSLLVNPSDISVGAPSILNDPMVGVNRLVINPHVAKTYNMKSSTPHLGDGTYKVVVNQYPNDFANSAEIARLNENSRVIRLTHHDGDCDVYRPNKEFTLSFQDKTIHKSHGGKYRLSRTLMVFSGQGSDMSLATTLTFKK